VLVKLAEIEFKRPNYHKCEQFVDAVIVRSLEPYKDSQSALFGFIMKAFLVALRGE